jgi:hypothetical protein
VDVGLVHAAGSAEVRRAGRRCRQGRGRGRWIEEVATGREGAVERGERKKMQDVHRLPNLRDRSRTLENRGPCTGHHCSLISGQDSLIYRSRPTYRQPLQIALELWVRGSPSAATWR